MVGQAQTIASPPIVDQFDVAIAIMDKCLKAAGAGAEHVVKVQVFMTDITERPKIYPRRIAYFGNNLLVSTLVEVKGLVDPRMKVEIECQAYVERTGTWSRRGACRPSADAAAPGFPWGPPLCVRSRQGMNLPPACRWDTFAR